MSVSDDDQRSGTRPSLDPDELRAALAELRDADQLPPIRHEGLRIWIRFAHLKPETQEWLLKLDAEEVIRLDKVQKIYARAEIMGSALKWLVASALALFLGIVAFGEAFAKVLIWLGKR